MPSTAHSSDLPLSPSVPPHGSASLQGGKRTQSALPPREIPIVTVITVTFNAAQHLEQTILSILNQTYVRYELIIIDGGSTDSTLSIIQKYDSRIDYWMSETDRGIYDAMNKAIFLAQGEWLSFMNAGDSFATNSTLEDVSSMFAQPEKAFLYSDVLLKDEFGHSRYHCNHRRRILNHQASIYRKLLHERYGAFLVANGVTISDYLFFSLIPLSLFLKVDSPIARYDLSGVSQRKSAVEQKFLIDRLINGMPKGRFILYFLLYYYYLKLKSLYFKLIRVNHSTDD